MGSGDYIRGFTINNSPVNRNSTGLLGWNATELTLQLYDPKTATTDVTKNLNDALSAFKGIKEAVEEVSRTLGGEKMFKFGDKVQVSDDKVNWKSAVYVRKFGISAFPHRVVFENGVQNDFSYVREPQEQAQAKYHYGQQVEVSDRGLVWEKAVFNKHLQGSDFPYAVTVERKGETVLMSYKLCRNPKGVKEPMYGDVVEAYDLGEPVLLFGSTQSGKYIVRPLDGNCSITVNKIELISSVRYKELFKQWLKKHDVMIGDKMRITRRCKPFEGGWISEWNSDMEKCIGNELTVTGISSRWVDFAETDYAMPFYCMKKVANKVEEFKKGDFIAVEDSADFSDISPVREFVEYDGDSDSIVCKNFENDCNIHWMKGKKLTCDDYTRMSKDWMKRVGLKVGDKVKVVRSVPSRAGGWGNGWALSMDEFVGKECTVTCILEGAVGIDLKCNDVVTFSFPFFVLDKVAGVEGSMSARDVYKAGQKKWIADNHLEVGSIVRVTKHFSADEDGSLCLMPTTNVKKREIVGELVQIVGINNLSISVSTTKGKSSWLCPYTALEVVRA